MQRCHAILTLQNYDLKKMEKKMIFCGLNFRSDKKC